MLNILLYTYRESVLYILKTHMQCVCVIRLPHRCAGNVRRRMRSGLYRESIHTIYHIHIERVHICIVYTHI